MHRLYIGNSLVSSDFVGLVHVSVSPVDLGAISHAVTVVSTPEGRRTQALMSTIVAGGHAYLI